MLFKHRKAYVLNFAVILTLTCGLFGAVPANQALAAPQMEQSNVDSNACSPNTGWVWAKGSSQPDIAQQAELALAQQGIEATVAATEFGEKDSCGNFELLSIDFKIKLKRDSNRELSPSAQSEFADGILSTLSQFGKPQLGNVQIDFGSGAAKSYSNSLNVQESITNEASPSSLSSEAVAPINKKVFLLVFNPTLSNGQDLNTYMGWPAYMTSVQGIINSFQSASQGQLQYSIVDTQVVTDEWPVKIDGFRYTEATYLAIFQNGVPGHSPDEVDYNVILNNPQFDICGKLNRGEIDELWMYGAPWFGFYESRLVGPGAYTYNSPPVSGAHTCEKLMPIMGLSYERGVADAVHSFGHRAEATMTKVYGGWEQNRTAHNWDRFGLVKAQSPNYSYSGCGSVHFPPNGTAGYDYGNPGSTLTNCEDFINYPNLSDPQVVAQPVTCAAWNCDHLSYMLYWFSHLPSNTGCGPDVVENNWWSYFADPSLALFPPLNCPPVPLGPISPGDTVRVSTNFAGGQALNDSESAKISADGHFVAFESRATNLVSGDTNGRSDVFVRDLQTGQITRVSVDSGGVQANDHSYSPSISADGRYIAFYSHATNLVSGDTNGRSDIFLHDRQTGIVTRISVDSGGLQSNHDSSYSPSISENGRYIVFGSSATNLVPGDTNGNTDTFLHDLHTGLTTRISVNSSGGQTNGGSTVASISADGRYVAFHSFATNLVPGDTNARTDVFLRDVQTSTTTRVSVNSNGAQANNGDSFSPSISADGRYVVFESNATNLVSGDTNARTDIFVRDLQTGLTTRASLASGGVQGNGHSSSPFISGNGRYVGFTSDATDLVPADTNAQRDAFLYDRQTGLTTRVSVASDGTQANNGSFYPSISADGQYIAFQGYATNLVAGDTNGYADIFVHHQDVVLLPTVTPTFTPTNTATLTPTATPSQTPTPTNTSPSGAAPFYLSLSSNQTIGGVASADEDILRFDGTNWSLFFDGSDVGVAGSDLFGFSIVDSDTFLMAFSSAVTVNGISALPQDILRFDATSLGANTAGTFSMYLNGIDVGLDVSAEKIDSVSLLADGRVLVSTTGNPVVTGVTGAKDEDVLAFTPTTLGNNTSGSWSMYFDGSDVGLAETSGEDVDAIDVVSGRVYLSTADNFAVNGVTGADEDVFVCNASSLGDMTACNYSTALYFDGSTWGLAANDVDTFNLSSTGSVPTVTPSITPGGPTITPTRTPTATFTPTPTFTAGIPTNTSTPTLTPNVSDLIFANGFESGNLSAWTSNTNDLGDLSASASAALVGSQGLQAVIDDANTIYVTDDSPNAEPRYRVRFYFDPNSIPMLSGDAHFIFKGFLGTSTEVLRMEFRQSAGAYQIRAALLDDGTTWINTNWFTISDASHFIELDWRGSTAAGANNGGLTLWLDGAQQADVTGIDNDTRRMDRVRLGALTGIDTGTRGAYFFDAFESRRQTYIGPALTIPTPTHTPTITPTLSSGSANVEVYAGGTLQDTYNVSSQSVLKTSYAGVNNGPVKVTSTNGVYIVASERFAYNNGSTWTSYSELMGLPSDQVTTTYIFPWYDNVDFDSQVRFGNIGASNTTVTITVAGVVRGIYNLAPNQSQHVSYAGLDAGPVKVQSSNGVPIIASLRVADFNGSVWTSHSELMGLPQSQLSTSYMFPWYNSVDIDSQLRFGNVGNTNTTVTVTVGGVIQGSYLLTPNQSQQVNYPALNNGPVKVESSGGVPIIASIRVAYFNGSIWTHHTETMGLPVTSLGTQYAFPVYDNVNHNSQLRIGNVGNTTTNVAVTIHGVLMGNYLLAPSQIVRVSYAGLNEGPVVIQSSGGVPIIASETVAYHDGNAWTSFSELIGLPFNDLATTYFFPWYNNVNLDTQLRFGVP